MSLNKLAKEIHDNAVDKGFYDKPLETGTLLMLIVSELGEALEADRKGWYHFKEKIKIEKPEFEEWRDVVFNKNYQVSNYGRVRSLKMKVFNGKVFYEKNGRVLKPGLSKTGYYTVSINKRSHKVAWLVVESFIGSRKGLVVNHINGDKTCDYSTNLEIVTYLENNNHALRTGLKKPASILTYKEKLEICHLKKNRMKNIEIQKKYNKVTLSCIKGITKNYKKYTDSFEIELADSLIRILDLCAYKKIDIESHVKAKMKYNSMRERLHGKKY